MSLVASLKDWHRAWRLPGWAGWAGLGLAWVAGWAESQTRQTGLAIMFCWFLDKMGPYEPRKFQGPP